MNYFDRDLAWSHDVQNGKQLDDFYFRVFPHLKDVRPVNDIGLQRAGIDKVLVLLCGKEILVDEKLRRKFYGDILLEEYSNFERGVVGWLSREKRTDYIIYAIIPANTIYLLPFLLLQSAYRNNYRAWLKRYGRKFSENIGYRTSNIPIPTQVLLSAINDEMKKNIIL